MICMIYKYTTNPNIKKNIKRKYHPPPSPPKKVNKLTKMKSQPISVQFKATVATLL